MVKSKPIKNRFSISLSEKEVEMLKHYASDQGLTRPAAIRRILKSSLKEYGQARSSQQPRNQIGLFDSIQIDIFNNTSKVEE